MKIDRTKPAPLVITRARTILVAAFFGRASAAAGEHALDELAQLVDTAGGEEVGRVTQTLARPDPGTLIGSGKADEVAELVEEREAHVVAFDNELTPSQEGALEKRLGCSVMGRSELILGIFARHARTKQAKLQVELAQLEYMLPRLKRLWTHLERQRGGIGLRGGAGERQIEVDRRKIRKRISDAKKEIREIESRRHRVVESRLDSHFTVSLVGYTNAGKSTLMRALTGMDVRIEDRLFATLDTKTGALAPDRAGGIEPPAGIKILVSDTVGFIRDLPHGLVASFHATLEEARTADLLLHVVDVSHPEFEDQLLVAEGVLKEIGADHLPTLIVLNKIDSLESQSALGVLCERHDHAVAISAYTGEGLGELRERVVALAARDAQAVRLKLSAADSETMRFLFRHGFNLERKYLDDGQVEVGVRLRSCDYAKLVGVGEGIAAQGGVEVLEGPARAWA
jgi:GTP-binding protein HflX